jgi:hypothetical protein
MMGPAANVGTAAVENILLLLHGNIGVMVEVPGGLFIMRRPFEEGYTIKTLLIISRNTTSSLWPRSNASHLQQTVSTPPGIIPPGPPQPSPSLMQIVEGHAISILAIRAEDNANILV